VKKNVVFMKIVQKVEKEAITDISPFFDINLEE